MKTLNEHSTKIFCALLDRLGNNDYLKIENEPFMALHIEKFDTLYSGSVVLVSLAHTYVQNGDLMHDPQICFAVADQRGADKKDYKSILIAPYLFRQDNMGIYEETILFEMENSRVIDQERQAGQAEFAVHWLKNIEAQGFLTA